MIVLPALRVHIGKAETLIHLRDVKAGEMVVILCAQQCRWLVGWPACKIEGRLCSRHCWWSREVPGSRQGLSL